LSRNVCKELPLFAAWCPRGAQVSAVSSVTLEISVLVFLFCHTLHFNDVTLLFTNKCTFVFFKLSPCCECRVDSFGYFTFIERIIVKIYNYNFTTFAPICFGPFGPSSGSLCRSLLKLLLCGIDLIKYIVKSLWIELWSVFRAPCSL
jgi:hypothetical protein